MKKSKYFLEIQDFLSSEECDRIVEMAKTEGLGISETVWSETDEVLTDGNLRAVFDKLDVNSDSSLDYYEVSVIGSSMICLIKNKRTLKNSPRKLSPKFL